MASLYRVVNSGTTSAVSVVRVGGFAQEASSSLCILPGFAARPRPPRPPYTMTPSRWRRVGAVCGHQRPTDLPWPPASVTSPLCTSRDLAGGWQWVPLAGRWGQVTGRAACTPRARRCTRHSACLAGRLAVGSACCRTGAWRCGPRRRRASNVPWSCTSLIRRLCSNRAGRSRRVLTTGLPRSYP